MITFNIISLTFCAKEFEIFGFHQKYFPISLIWDINYFLRNDINDLVRRPLPIRGFYLTLND